MIENLELAKLCSDFITGSGILEVNAFKPGQIETFMLQQGTSSTKDLT